MRLRHWLATALSLGFLLSAPAFVFAEDAAPADQGQTQAAKPEAPKVNVPQACADAGIDNPDQCKAFLAKAEADKAAAEKAAADKAAAANAAAEKAAADKAAADQAAAEKAAADKAAKKAAAEQAAAEKAAADKAAADQAAAEKAAADKAAKKAAADQAAADKAAADKAAADKAAAAAGAAATPAAAGNAPAESPPAADQGQKPKRLHLAKDCVAAGITIKEDCDAFHASNGKPNEVQNGKAPAAPAENAAPAAPADNATAPTPKGKPAPDTTAAQPAAEPAANPPADQNGKPARVRLAKDCVAAGITTKEDCDALHAINAQKGKGQPPADQQPAAEAPAAAAKPAATDQHAAPPPAVSNDLPAEVTPAKPETAQKPAETAPPATPALPDITSGLDAAARSYNKAVGALGQPDQADKARAEIKAQQGKIDALCKTNKFDSTAQCLAQYGVILAPVPASEAPGGEAIVVKPVQPVEVIPNLPKGVTPQEVAPLLDSAKDQDTGKTPAPKPADQGQPPAAIPSGPPPANDKAAQADLKPVKVVPIDQTKGQQIEAGAATPQIQVPQNVTIINQTTVNNTTVNNTTNNQQINNGPGVQQNNGTPGNQQSGRPGNGRPGAGPGGFPGNGPGRPGRPGFPGNNEPPNPIGLGIGIILQLGNQLIINSPAQDQQRIAGRPDDQTTYEKLPGDRYRETITRPDGVRIVTIYNRNGDILRRSRFDRSGHEIVLAYFDDRHDQDLLDWRDPGQDLPPLRLRIPARDYVLDADDADEADVQQFFAQPPVEQVQRLYSIDEVKRSARIRDMVRRLEIGDLTFDTGAATISEDQVGNLSKVANAMLALLKRNPAETFLIEGHTDAVGSDIANLQLSDARAATVASILTDFYHIPPENLATQGYGERFLKVQTDGPERLNRRVTIRRITPLVTVANQNY